MASYAEGQVLRELLGDELFKDYFDDETMKLSSSAAASDSSATEFKTASSEDLERLISNTETMLSTNPHPWPHMPFSVPYQPSTPVYNYFSNCTVYMTPNGIAPAPQGKENQPQPPKRPRIMDSDDEL